MADSLTNILDMLRQRGTIDPKTMQQLGGRNPAISADIYPPKPAAPKPPAVQPTMTGATRANAKVTHTADIYAPPPGQPAQPVQPWTPGVAPESQTDFQSILRQIGSPGVSAPPELTVDADYVNQLIQQWGIAPRSQEEIAAHAKAVVERQALERSQLIQRELDRFERDFPHEFEKASNMIREEANKMNAQYQEEFAARGMFYSSVMASAMGQVDEKATEMIGEIARDAANRVAELHADLRDVAEWAILEEEVLRHQLTQEDQALRQQLMNVSLEVAMRAEQNALDRWYQQQQLQLQAYAQKLQAAQLQAQQARDQGQELALAFMANDPTIREQLTAMGVNQQQWNSMPLNAQAALVGQVIDYSGIRLQMEGQRLNNELLARELAIQEEYGTRAISGEQALAYIETPLRQLHADVSVKKLKPEEAERIAFDLQALKSIVPSVTDSTIRDRMNQQISYIEQKLEALAPGTMSRLATGVSTGTVTGTSTGFTQVGKGLGVAGSWTPVGLSLNFATGAWQGLTQPASSFGQAVSQGYQGAWENVLKQMGITKK
jgi:hypothetical protein